MRDENTFAMQYILSRTILESLNKLFPLAVFINLYNFIMLYMHNFTLFKSVLLTWNYCHPGTE